MDLLTGGPNACVPLVRRQQDAEYDRGVPVSRDDVDRFERARPRLEAIAYRLLGSADEAQDVVQETFLRWHAADVDRIEVPEAWLTKVLTNLCLNQLTSARARRESYVGQWLPEPLLGGDPMLGPADTAEQHEEVTYAVLTLLERLSPNERAVYVLREAFDYPHREISEVLDISEAASQQILHRAKEHVAHANDRPQIDTAAAQRIVEEFLAAATSGQTDELVRLLTKDATAIGEVAEGPGAYQGVRGCRRGREVRVGHGQAGAGQASPRRWIARAVRLDRQRRTGRRRCRGGPGRRHHVPGGQRGRHRGVPYASQPRQARTCDRAVGHGRPWGTAVRDVTGITRGFCQETAGHPVQWHPNRTGAEHENSDCRSDRGDRYELVPRLTEAGHEVFAMIRKTSDEAKVAGLGAVPVIADALNRAEVEAAVRQAAPDVIVHQLTAIGPIDTRHFERSFAATNRLRTEGTDNLLAAARAAGVRRFVAQSNGAFTYARTGGPVKDERDPLDSSPVREMGAMIGAIEHLESAVLAASWTRGSCCATARSTDRVRPWRPGQSSSR